MDDVNDAGVSMESSLTMPATEPTCAQAVNLSIVVQQKGAAQIAVSRLK